MIPLGHKRDVKVEVDPESRLDEMGVSGDPEVAEDKWGDQAAKPAQKKSLGEANGPASSADFDGHTKDDDEFVDPGFFRIDIDINGKVFKLAADHILRLRSEDLSSSNSESFDEQLEACTFYRFSLFSAAMQVRRDRQSREHDFRRWLAGVQKEHRSKLAIQRKSERSEHGLTSRDQPGITKDEVLDHIITDADNGEVYVGFQLKINDLKRKEDLLLELRDCLHDRGFHLGGIAERLSQHRKKPQF